MTLAAERELMHLGESRGCADHDHDLIHELSRRLDLIWRYDQYIANADGRTAPKKFWEQLRAQEHDNIKRLKQLVKKEIENDCF